MPRDPQLILRILKEIESWDSGSSKPRRLVFSDVDKQALLDQLAMMEEEG